MNATDDEHIARVTMAWSISTKTVQPVFMAEPVWSRRPPVRRVLPLESKPRDLRG